MLSLRTTIQMNRDVAYGPGKLSIYPAKERHGDSFAAVVHSEEVDLLLFDREGNILQKDSLTIEQLKWDKTNEIKVLWCSAMVENEEEDSPLLILAQAKQLLRAAFDRSANVWKADLNARQPGWIYALVASGRWIYTGGEDGIWEVDSSNLQPLRQLCAPGALVTTVSLSEQYLIAGLEDGGLVLLTGGLQNWEQSGTREGYASEGGRICCTSLLQHLSSQVLLAAQSNGSIRVFSLPDLHILSETAAHIRLISLLLPVKDGFVSAAEDGFLHLWRVEEQNPGAIQCIDSLELKDGLITDGAIASQDDGEGGTALVVTSYDRAQLYWLAAYQNPTEGNKGSNDKGFSS